MLSSRRAGFSLVLGASFLNAIIPSVTQRALLTGLPIETILTSRYLMATCLLWGYIFITKRNFLAGRNNIFYMLTLGFLLFTCTTCLNESYKYLPGAISAVLGFTYVAIVVLIEILTGRTKAGLVKTSCLLLSLTGLTMVVWPQGGVNNLSHLGILFALLGAFFYAMQTLGIAAKRLEKIDAIVITAYMALFIFFANFLRTSIAHQAYLPSEPIQWWYIFIVGAGGAFIAPTFFCKAVKLIGASDSALTNTTEPVIAYIAGILLMGDRISFNATLGGIFVLSSVFLLNLSEKFRSTRKAFKG